LVDAVWGGGFNTRLNMNLREDKGYSYGAFSFLRPYSASGCWMASAGVQSAKTKESVAEFMKELALLGGGRPISEKELADAKANRVRGYAQQFEALFTVGNQVGQLWLSGLPMTELQREYDATGQATLPAVQAAEKKYVNPAETRLLLVGDREKILEAARDLKLGEVVFLDSEGKVISPK
jgi:predicted Zn-dependent peptidase